MKQIDNEILGKKYFIFDIDGTLVDSMRMWNLIDQAAVYNASGIFVSEEDIKTIRDAVLYNENNIGGNIYELFYQEIISVFGLNMSVEEYRQVRHDYANRMSREEIDFKPGAGEFLQAIKLLGKKIGIATTTTNAQLEIYSSQNEKMKKKAEIKKIADAIVACEDVTYKKPNPEAYLKVLERLGAKQEECIVFEDSINGVISAKNAGLEVVAIYDESAAGEQHLIEKIADYKVESFEELIKILGLDKHQGQPS